MEFDVKKDLFVLVSIFRVLGGFMDDKVQEDRMVGLTVLGDDVVYFLGGCFDGLFGADGVIYGCDQPQDRFEIERVLIHK